MTKEKVKVKKKMWPNPKPYHSEHMVDPEPEVYPSEISNNLTSAKGD